MAELIDGSSLVIAIEAHVASDGEFDLGSVEVEYGYELATPVMTYVKPPGAAAISAPPSLSTVPPTLRLR
jgi:hypothetical protein